MVSFVNLCCILLIGIVANATTVDAMYVFGRGTDSGSDYSQDVDELHGKVDSHIRTTRSALNAEIQKVEGQIIDLRSELHTAKRGLSSNIEKVGQDLGEAESRLSAKIENGLTSGIGKIGQDLTQTEIRLCAKIDDLENSLTSESAKVKNDLSQTEIRLSAKIGSSENGLNAKIDTLVNGQSRLSMEIGGVKEDISTLSQKLDKILEIRSGNPWNGFKMLADILETIFSFWGRFFPGK